MKTHFSKIVIWCISMAFLAAALCVSLFFGLFGVVSLTVNGEEKKYESLTAEFTVDVIYDDYDAETVKKDLRVTGVDENGIETVIISGYSVEFANGGLTAGADDNAITVRYLDLAVTLSGITVEKAEATAQISAISEFVQSDRYYINSEGYYAFVQGMTDEQVQSRLAVALVYPNHTEYLPFGTNVSWNGSAPSFGDAANASDITVSISLSVSGVDGVEEVNGDVVFAASRRTALKLVGDWTQPDNLTPATDVKSFINTLQGKVYPVLNSGFVDGTAINVDNELIYGGLYVGATYDALKMKEGEKFPKTLEIPYNGSGVEPLKLDLTVIFKGYAGIERKFQGNLPAQIARSEELDYGEVYAVVFFEDENHLEWDTKLYLKDVPKESISATFLDASNKPLDSLTRSVNIITLSFEAPDGSKVTGNFSGIQVSSIGVARPVIADTELTYSDKGCSTTISGLITSDEYNDYMDVTIACDNVKDTDYAKRTGDVITFSRGGTYQITVYFVKGKDSDFSFLTGAGDGVVDAEDPTKVTYTVKVLKAPVEITLENFPNEIQYGEAEPAYSVKGVADGSDSMKFTATNKIDNDVLPAEENKTSEAPSYRLYYTGTLATGGSYVSYDFPAERGKYEAHVSTAETAWYDKGELKTPYSFEIVQRKITLTDGYINPVTFALGVEYGEDEVVNYVDVSNFTAADKSNPKSVVSIKFTGANAGKTVTHANTYGVTITIINSNYKWSDTTSADKATSFTINKAALSFTASQGDFIYGENKKDAVLNDSGLNGLATIGEPSYTKEGSAFTPVNGVWPAGSYEATYAIGSYTDGVLASDVTCNSVTASFTVSRREITQISVDTSNDGQTYKGEAWNFALNNYVKDENVLPLENGAIHYYKDILSVSVSGKLITDGSVSVTTAVFDKENGVIKIIDAGNYVFEISIINDNFTWTGESVPQTVTAEAEILQRELKFKLTPDTDFSYIGENQVPETSVEWELGEQFEATLECSYYTEDNEPIDKDKIVNAGGYKIVVTGFTISAKPDGASYTYAVNYKLPADSSLSFRINTPYLVKPVLKGEAEVTYQGKNNPFNILDFIDGNYVYIANGEQKCSLKFTYTIGSQSYETLAIAGTYTVSVTPAENFKWDNGSGSDGGETPVTFEFKINRLSVILDWEANSLSSTYGYAPAPVVKVGNAVSGDNVSVNIAYKDKDGVNAIADLTAQSAAGYYTVYAYEPYGADSANYVIDASVPNANISKQYTVFKKALAKPLQKGAAESTFDGSVWNESIAGFGSYNLTSELVQAEITGVRPADWFGSGEAVVIDTSDSQKYSFNVSDGKFTCFGAGYYSVEFIIKDSANYCWEGESSDDFGFTGNYTHSWNEFAKIERQTLTAPVLGANRAMEWETVTALSSFLNGNVGGVGYEVLYGINGGDKTSSEQGDVDGFNGKTANRGQYYALLTLNDRSLNYIWEVVYDNENHNGYAGASFVNGGEVYEIFYTVENGAQVKLYYAITSSQVDVQLTVNDYWYGDNGAYIGEAANSVVKGRNDVIVLSVSDENATFNGPTGGVEYTFYNDGKEMDEDELVNGLPWEAGEYGVRIVITFDKNGEDEVYSQWDSNIRQITVKARQLSINWTYAGKTGENISTSYNGENQMPTAEITNMPSKYAKGDVSLPDISYNYTDSNLPVNANTYTVKVTSVAGGNFDPAGAPDCSFVITKYNVTVEAVEVDNHVYGDTIEVADKWQYGSDGTFFNSDAQNVKLVILNGSGEQQVSSKTSVGNYKLCPVWESYSELSIDENGEYVLETENYTIKVKSALFAVVQRRLTVSFIADGKAASVYGETADLYREGVVYTVSTDNGKGEALVDEVKKVFVLTASLNSVAAVGDSRYWSAGVYSVSGKSVSSDYSILFNGTGKYEIKEAEINIKNVTGYNNVYDASGHDLFTFDAETVNEQKLEWFYKEVTSTEWLPYVSDGKTAQIKNVSESAVYHVKAKAPNHGEKVFEIDEVYAEVKVTVSKATLHVQINLELWYGERTPSGTVNADALVSDADKYFIKAEEFAGTEKIGDINATGTFTFDTTYVQGDKADSYVIDFVKGSITAPNYEFENATGSDSGILIVKPLELTVTIEDIENVYYDTYSNVKFKTSVTLPESTYTGLTLTQSELPESVWEEIFNANAAYTGANIVTLKTTAFKSTSPNTHSEAFGEYVVSGSLIAAKTNFAAIFVGSNGDTAKHNITKATLSVSDITGYVNDYDEEEHLALIVKRNGSVSTVFATANDGTEVIVSFYSAEYSPNAVDAADLNWNGLTLATDPVKYIDVCHKNVYFRISAGDNYETVYGMREVEISFVENAVKNINALSFKDWTYGLYSSSNLSGYNIDGAHKITEPEAVFTRLVSNGIVSQNAFRLVMTRDGSPISEIDGKNYETISGLFAEMWLNGLFTAGEYELTITMIGTDNYGDVSETFDFTVYKKALKVTAADADIIYGDEAPASYGYIVSGFVAGKSDGVLDKESDIIGLNKKFFTSDYAAGRLSGSVGTYDIKHFEADGNTVISGLTDIELENYSIIFVKGTLSVARREITVTINDAENFYNLSTLKDGLYEKEDVAEWEKGYSVSGVYGGDTEDEIQQIFALRTDALSSAGNKLTNDAGTYSIYAEWLTFNDKNGNPVSFGKNYSVIFENCSYGGDLPENAITQQNNSYCAGTYTIKQAFLAVDILGPYNDADGSEAATNGNVFSNTQKYYKAFVSNDADEVDFVVTYYLGNVISSDTRLSDAPVNVGKYTVTATTDNNNYVANRASIPVEIYQATLNVGWVVEGTIAAEIEYGENIPDLEAATNSYPANSRFTGLVFDFTSPHFEELSESELIALLGEVVYGYTTDYNDKTSRDVYIRPAVTVSSNFSVTVKGEILRVISRKITVQVNGYDEGNLTATSHYTGKAPFADNKGWEIENWLKEIETDAFVHGHGLADLAISLTIESQNYNASETPYKVNVIKGNNTVSNYYNVTFVVGDEKIPYSNEVKPTYLITKKGVTVTAKDVTVTYGNAIDSNVANGILQSNLSVDVFNRYFTVSGFENGESYMYINDSAMQNNRFVFSTAYVPYQSRVGNDISLNINGSELNFTNYKVDKFVSGKVVVIPRVISAITYDEVYAEETDAGNNKLYNNGVYGVSRNATITFIGHDNGVGYAAGYAPSFSVSYNTVAGAGQTAKSAPVKVGSYIVTVQLTTNDYVFENNNSSSNLPFNVTKRTISPSWLNLAIANNPQLGETVDLSNSVADYIASIMTLSNFQKTVGDSVTAIPEGTDTDQYRIGLVGSERVGLYITAQGTGEYRVTFEFTAAATANYQWDDNDSATEVTIIFNVTTNKVYITGLGISGWIYKQYDAKLNAVNFDVSNGNKNGVQITYARITGQIPTDLEGFQRLSYSASIPEAAGNYAVRAYYPSFQGVGGDEQFISFTISKATVNTPAITVSGNNVVFNGLQLNSSVEFDPLVLRIGGFNGTGYVLNESGATLYALNAGTYTVSFAIIDSLNYQWGSNASSVDWEIQKAENNAVTWHNTEAQRTVVYGNTFVPEATATYGGTVYYRYMLKTDGVVPAEDDVRWVASFNKFYVGEYWVMASNSSTSNYNGDVKIISFTVTKATLTVTPYGSIIYGNEFVNTNPAFNYTVTDGLVRGDDPGEVIKTTSETLSYAVAGSPSKFQAKDYDFVLVTDSNGEVIGLEADNYKIVSGTGVFTVNRRSVVVYIGNKTSQYGRPVDVSDVAVTYGSQNGLVEGDNLNLSFTTNATLTSNKGGYIINATYNNGNYNATIYPGTYTITERLITVEIVQGGGVYGENIAEVKYSKVIDDEQLDITDFVTGKLNITVVYSGTANDGTAFNGTEMPLLAGTYVATVKGSGNDNFIVVGEPFAQFIVSKKEVDGSLITVANQTYDGEVKIPVIDSSAFVSAYGENIYDELAHGEFINAGDHSITLRLKDSDNYKWLSVEIAERDITFTIDKADNRLTGDIVIAGWVYGEYSSQANAPSAEVKFGQNIIVYEYCDTIDGIFYSGAPITGNAGEYYVRVTVVATDNYNAFESAPVKFEITRKALAKPSLVEIKDGEGKNDVYTGGELLSTVSGFDMALMSLDYEGKTNVSGGRITLVAVDAGTYTVKINISNVQNYLWEGETDGEIVLSWTIAPKAVAKPTANTSRFMVNGQTLTYIPEGFDGEIMTIEGNQTAYGGEFKVTVGLKDKTNYVWSDGGVEDITFNWTVTGINTVFKIVVGTLSGVCGLAVIAAGVQLLINRRRKRLIDRDIDLRSREEFDRQTEANTIERGDE